MEVTNFTDMINPVDSEAILNVVRALQDHYYGQRVWVKYAHDL